MGGLKGWDGADRHRCQEGAPQGMFSMGLLVPPCPPGTATLPGTPGPVRACLIHAGAGGGAALKSLVGTLQSWLGFLPQSLNTALLPQGSSGAPRDPSPLQ